MATTPNNISSLTTLIKRLEAATSRLEDIATATEIPQAVPALTSISNAISASAPPEAEEVPDFVSDFDNIVNDSVTRYVEASRRIGGLVTDQAEKVLMGFLELRKFLLISSKAKNPGSDMAVLSELLSPINEVVMAVGTIKDSGRSSPYYNHLSAVAEGVMVLAWVTVEPRPHKHVDESLGSAQYWGNRVLKDYKDKDPNHVEWVHSFYRIFGELSQYVKDRFSNGLTWNPKGAAPRDVAKSLSASNPPPSAPALPAGGVPPPPPPPGPPPPPAIEHIQSQAPAAGSGGKSGLGAVFSDINKGEAITKALRKVDKSEMTHKNPALRGTSLVPDSGLGPSARGQSPAPPSKKPKPESMRVKKPPKKVLEDNKWFIENYEHESAVIEIQAELSHSVLISKCNHTTVVIKGKANAVTVENTSRLSLAVDTLISTVDAIKSQNFALQVMGTVPTVMLDQIDSAQIYLSKESMKTKLYTSNSTSINLAVLAGKDGDNKEIPLPSQICSYYDEDKDELVSEIVAHSG
jgi:adenylyl cyclase-associated protein